MSSGVNSLSNNDILYNLLSNNSRYINLDIVDYDDKLCINVPNKLNIQSSTNSPDNTIVVTGRYVNRLDLVSLRFYSTPKYWWVLAYYNNIENPYFLPYGTVLKVPSYSTLLLNNIIKS